MISCVYYLKNVIPYQKDLNFNCNRRTGTEHGCLLQVSIPVQTIFLPPLVLSRVYGNLTFTCHHLYKYISENYIKQRSTYEHDNGQSYPIKSHTTPTASPCLGCQELKSLIFLLWSNSLYKPNASLTNCKVHIDLYIQRKTHTETHPLTCRLVLFIRKRKNIYQNNIFLKATLHFLLV